METFYFANGGQMICIILDIYFYIHGETAAAGGNLQVGVKNGGEPAAVIG